MVSKYSEKVLSLVGKSADKPASADEGTTYFEIDTKKIYIWDGSSWVDITAVATYTV